MGNCTSLTIDTHSLVTTAIAAVLEAAICLLDGGCGVLEVDVDLFKLGHGCYLLIGVV